MSESSGLSLLPSIFDLFRVELASREVTVAGEAGIGMEELAAMHEFVLISPAFYY